MKIKTPILRFIKDRFPLHILTFTTLSTVLATAQISSASYSFIQLGIAFLITTFALFHVRAIDERRDFVLDTKLHPKRPVQLGVISVRKLLTLSVFGMIFSLVLALYFDTTTFLITLFFIVFTTFAALDFFIAPLFTNRPLLYHIVNSPQMILLQWMMLSVFTQSFEIQNIQLLFMALVYNNIFILEVVRKVKNPENDSSDTYSSILGLKRSILILSLLVVSGFIFYVLTLNEFGKSQSFYTVAGALLCVGVLITFWVFYYKPKKRFQKIMELASLLMYIFLNLFIFFAK